MPVRVSSVLTSLGFNYGSLEGVHPLKDRKFNEGKLDTDKSKFTQSVVQMIKSGYDKKDFTNLANFLEFNKSQDEPGTGLEARRKDESLIIKTGSGSDYYGLQNLNIPKLNYEMVYEIKKANPELEIIINGGVSQTEQIKKHLEHCDGVMIGRAIYQNPYFLAEIEDKIFNNKNNSMKYFKPILWSYQSILCIL